MPKTAFRQNLTRIRGIQRGQWKTTIMLMWKHIIVVVTDRLEMNHHRARPNCTHRMQSAQGP